MKRVVIFPLLLLFCFVQSAISQVVTTSPASVSASGSLIITFDATKGNAGLSGYTGDVYAHIGVITDLSSNDSDWKHAPTAWGDNSAKYKLSKLSSNIYTLTLSPSIKDYFGVTSETIYKIGIVFRSSDGLKIGKDTSNSDILINMSGVVMPKDGVTYLSDTSVKLTLTAPNKTAVHAIGSFNNWTADASSLMTKNGDKFTITLTGLTKGLEYQYQYKIDNSIVVADPYTELVIDPDMDKWIPSLAYPGINNSPSTAELARGRTAWFKTGQTPYNWKVQSFTGPSNQDLVVYELLVRDWQRSSLNGSDRGIIKTLSDSIAYFKRLNINAIHIMPFNEFEGDDSWGYNPSFYFAPDKAYGPKEEYKRFIDLCHQNGIAVIMDLVLNHSFGQSPMGQMYWNSTLSRPAAGNPWYNEVSPNTCWGWGLDFNHESSYTKKFIDDVTEYWLTEYKIDGFRFDFTKGFTQKANCGWDYDASRVAILKRMADKIWAVKPGAYVILEHLTDNWEELELSNYGATGMMMWSGVDLNNRYGEAVMGWNEIVNGTCKSDFSSVSYKSRGWTRPNLMSYMESHDEERIAYKGKTYGNGDKSMDNVLKRCGAAAAMYFTVPGPKLIWQFGERGYDVSIDSIGRTDAKPPKWEQMQSTNRKALWAIYSNLINLKRNEPVFKSSDFGVEAGNSNGLKRIWINSTSNDVRVVANFGVTTQSTQPFFSSTGIWYDHFAGQQFNVTDVNMSVSLGAGDFKLFSKIQMEGYGGGIYTELNSDIEIVQNELNIYPQPAIDLVTISCGTTISQVEIIDLQGISRFSVDSDMTVVDFSISSLSSGVYIVKVTLINGETIIKRIIKS